MRQVLWLVLSLFAFLASSILPNLAIAFDEKAHEALTGRAVSASKLDSFLKNELSDFPAGVNEEILGQGVVNWIQDGSIREDSPPTRVRNHFHDPTKTWNQAGLFGIFSSSILWAQEPSQIASWQRARDSYYEALTQPTQAARVSKFAKTFFTLGHVIHHVQDAASPAHTRNDPHLPPDKDRFHIWGDKEGLGTISSSTVTFFDASILDLPENSLAPIPIARIIDTGKYEQDLIPRSTTDIGIAEYSKSYNQKVWK